MHRSGTSLCMQILNHLGFRLDDDLFMADTNNERGYFESRELVELNEELMAALGVSWYTLFSLALGDHSFEASGLSTIRERLARTVGRKAAAGPGTWAFKDPRLCGLLPIYEQVWADCGLDPLYVLCIRDPRAVATSLERRNGFPRVLSELLWMENTVRAVRIAGPRIRAVVHYEEWFRSGGEQMHSLAAGLGLGRDACDISVLEANVCPVLDHSGRGGGPFALAQTETIYRALQNNDREAAVSAYSGVQQALRWAASPGKNTSRLCWRTETEGFLHTRSSNVLTDIGSGRALVRLAFPAGYPVLRLHPAGRPGLVRLAAIRTLDLAGKVAWQWDGRAESLHWSETSSMSVVGGGVGPGLMIFLQNASPGILLPLGPADGGVVELEFAWLATDGPTEIECSRNLACQIAGRNREIAELECALGNEIAALRCQADAQAAKEACLLRELEHMHARQADVLRSWSWRLTSPLRALGSLWMR